MSEAALEAVVATEPRTFKTVKGALLWYQQERARREVQGQNMEGSRGGRERGAIERDRLAFGLLACCLQPAPAEDEHDPLKKTPLLQLMHWILEYRKHSLADELGLTEHVMSKRMGYLESRLARRMRDRGLLMERGED